VTVSIVSKPEPRAYQMELAFVLVGARLRHNEALWGRCQKQHWRLTSLLHRVNRKETNYGS